jgi:hypothetical protein
MPMNENYLFIIVSHTLLLFTCLLREEKGGKGWKKIFEENQWIEQLFCEIFYDFWQKKRTTEANSYKFRIRTSYFHFQYFLFNFSSLSQQFFSHLF